MSSWPVVGGFFQVYNALYGELRKRSSIIQVHDGVSRLQCVSLNEAKNKEISTVHLVVKIFSETYPKSPLEVNVSLRIVSEDSSRVVEYVKKVFSSRGEGLDAYDKKAFESLTQKLIHESAEQHREPREEVPVFPARKGGKGKKVTWADPLTREDS
jgi:hypothetical protein